jgi:hypothetical protein
VLLFSQERKVTQQGQGYLKVEASEVNPIDEAHSHDAQFLDF